MKVLEKALSVEQLEERFEMAVAPGPQTLGCSCFNGWDNRGLFKGLSKLLK